MKTKTLRKPKVHVVTLGCSKNTVDSEVLMGQLRANNHEVVHDSDDENSSVVIINTCGFIDNAKQESINTILEYSNQKREGRIDKLIVTGCLSQRYRDELKDEMKEVDNWFGTSEMPRLLKTLKADYKHELVGERLLTTPSHYAYIKISEGCNRTCSFCAIPLMRGKHISKPIEEIEAEIKKLVKQGVKEFLLIAQELTYYGLDLYKERKLSELLNRIADIDGVEWIRLHYAYPNKFPVEILDVVRERSNICNYLDIPFQHISDPVLKAMKRQTDKAEITALINTIREKVPGIALRTTMLVGFPGERKEHFDELVEFVKEVKFDRLGVFTYSPEEGTSGYELVDDVTVATKKKRAQQLMDVQQEISRVKNEEKIDRTFRVLFDRKEGEYFIGRTEHDSPEIDNEVLVKATDTYLRVGDFANIKITSAEEFDLYGEKVD
ncbi:MAG: 30S ribosomal protein S12 methylthiotransferase RimO [Sphingobacteriales bacterium]|nr:MAG: 30S ribosomal protein S12 methylthiotransferase RimO [Sphingobacteriales bacterium]